MLPFLCPIHRDTKCFPPRQTYRPYWTDHGRYFSVVLRRHSYVFFFFFQTVAGQSIANRSHSSHVEAFSTPEVRTTRSETGVYRQMPSGVDSLFVVLDRLMKWILDNRGTQPTLPSSASTIDKANHSKRLLVSKTTYTESILCILQMWLFFFHCFQLKMVLRLLLSQAPIYSLSQI